MSFEQFLKQYDIEKEIYLSMNVYTRWKPTYLMIECVFKYKRAFNYMKARDINSNLCLSP